MQEITVRDEFELIFDQIIIPILNKPKEYVCGFDYRLFISVTDNSLNSNSSIFDRQILKDFENDILKTKFKDLIIIPFNYNIPKEYIHNFYHLPEEFESTSTECLCKHIYDLLIEYLNLNNKSFKKIEIEIHQTFDEDIAYFSEIRSE